MRRTGVCLSLLLAASLIFTGAVFANGGKEKAPAAGAKTATAPGKYRIALSNYYAANSWRQQMLTDFKVVVEEAKAKGLIADGAAFTTNDVSAAEQAAQIQNLTLEGYDAILVTAASPTALNGAVQKAMAAGVQVISFDNPVTEENAWKIGVQMDWYGAQEVEYIAKTMGTKGNILEIRGVAGTGVEAQIHDGIMSALAKYPDLKIVGTVVGNWDAATAQKAVAGILPSLPKIDAVVDQGGDGYGAVMAFKAAGLPIPMVMMGNRYDELALWKQMKTENGYKTWSAAGQPSCVQVAFWSALQILNGDKSVPKSIMIRPLVVTSDSLDLFLKNTAKGGVATLYYPQDWVANMVKVMAAGQPEPPDPIPAN